MTNKLTIDKLGIMIGDGFKDADRKIEELRSEMDSRFNKVDEHFNKVETTMEHRFDEVDSRLTSVEKRLWKIEDTLEPVGRKINI